MIWNWIIAAVTAAVSYSAHKKAKQAMRDAEDAAKGVLINKNSNIDFIPVVYGTRRVGGTRVFISTKDVSGGDENEYLYIALVLSEGEVESITDLKFDDIDSSDTRFDNLIDYNVHLGTDNQAADSLLQEAPGWTSSHQLKGVAYIALRLKYDQDAWSGIPNITAVVQGRKLYDPRTQQTVFSNNPALCLYDYLTNTRYGKGLLPTVIDQASISTAANECDQFEVTPYSGGSDIKIFQCNYVLKPEEKIIDNVRDILASCRGFLPFSNGKYSLKIDSASSSVKTFNTDNILGGINIKGGDKSTTQNRNMIKFANADIDYQPDQAAYPDPGSTEDETYLEENNDERLQETVELKACTDYYIARDFARIITERSRNHLRVTFQTDSSGLELNTADVITVNHPTPDWGDKLFQVEEITLNADMTANILAIEYDSSIYAYDESAVQKTYPDTNLPNPFSVSPPTNLTSTNSTAVSGDGSVIPSLTFNWTAPDDSFVQKYEFQYKRESALLDHGVVTESHTENPDYGLITDNAGVTVDYGNVTDAATTGETAYTSVIVNSTQFVITGTVPDVNYNVRVRSINDLSVRSSFIDLSALVAGDTTPPSIPNSVAAAGGLKEITITWERPVEHDYSHVEVWEGIVGSTLAANKIAIASGDSYTRTGLDYDVTRYYHLKSVDFSGNVSAFSSTVSATTLFVDSDAFSDNVTNLFAEAGAYGIEPVATLPASGDFIGQIKFNSTNVALYRWTGTEWTDDIFTIEEASVSAASFANEIEPVSIVNSLPSPTGYTGPTMVFLTTDSQLYRYDSSVPEFTRAIQTIDLVGEVAEVNFSEDLMPPKVVSTLPTAAEDLWQGRQVFLTTDNKLYRYNGTEWTTAVSTTDLAGQVSGPQIQDDAISNAKIAVDAIQGDVIAAAAIDGDKIADDAISAAKLAAQAVETASLALEAVTADIVAAGAITNVKIADTAVDADKIADAAVIAAKIGEDAVTTAKIANDAITTDLIAASAITETEIGADAVTTAKLANDAVTSDVIAAGAITETEIADSSVTANKVGDSAIVAAKIATDAVTSAKIAIDAVTSDAIAASAITATEISDNAVVTAKINSGAITTAKIDAGAVTANEISANAVTTAKIDAEAITSAKITAEAITSDKVAANAITASKMVLAGSGSCLNDDPLFKDSASWNGNATFIDDLTLAGDLAPSEGVVGNNGIRNATGQQSTVSSVDLIPVDFNKTYRVRCFASESTNNTGRLYVGVDLRDENNTKIAGDGSYWSYDAAFAVKDTDHTWIEYSAEFGAGTDNDFPSNAKTMRPLLLLSHISASDTANGITRAGHWYAQDLRIEEMTPASLIVDGAITTAKIDAEAVTAGEIAANAITTAKIDANAITASEIAADAVTSDKIIANAVTTAKIDAGAVTADEIEANAVTTAKINAGAVTADEIGANAVTSDKVNANAITAGKIDSGAITSSKIDADAVTAGKIAASAVTADKIDANAVTSDKINAQAVTANEIASNAITSVKINANAITAGKIATDAVTANKIEANAVTADKINASAVTADKINAGAVTTAKISAGAVTAGEIAANTITSSQIASDAITANEIAAGAVNAEQINAGAITGDKIDANTITASKMVLSGAGSALNNDPLFNDPASWVDFFYNENSSEFYELNGPQVGKYAIRNKNGKRAWVNSAELIPFDHNKTYRVHAKIKKGIGGTNGNIYLGVGLFTKDGVNIAGSGTQWRYMLAAHVPSNTSWIDYSYQFGNDTNYEFDANGVYMKPLVLLNHRSGAQLADGNGYIGHYYCQDLRLEEAATAELIVDGAIKADKIASNAVTANKISASAVTADKINAGAITAAKIAADAITSDKIAADAVTSNTIAANAITSGKIAANTITAGNIAANAITSSELAANSVTAGSLAAGAISADAIDSNIITSDHIASNTIQTDNIAANQITGGLIAASGVITSAAQINDLVVSSAKIANGAISSAKIGTAAITNAKIGNLEVDTIKIANNAVTVSAHSLTATSQRFKVNNWNKIGRGYFNYSGFNYSTFIVGGSRYTLDLASVTLNVAAGAPIFLDFYTKFISAFKVNFSRNGNRSQYAFIEVVRGTTVINQSIVATNNGIRGADTNLYNSTSHRDNSLDRTLSRIEYTYVDANPPSGNQTYKIRYSQLQVARPGADSDDGTIVIKDTVFRALELKK